MDALATPKSVIKRVRAILLTNKKTMLFIKRVKPNTPPYWVAPGGGVEDDETLLETLQRELHEELGAKVEVLETAFILEHTMAGKQLEEHFFICRLLDYDLTLREGPEFADPKRGEYLPDEIPLTEHGLRTISIKTPQLADWLLDNLPILRAI